MKPIVMTLVLGYVRDACNFVSQQGSSEKVHLLSQHISSTLAILGL